MPASKMPGIAPLPVWHDAQFTTLSAVMEQIVRNAQSVAHILPALEMASFRASRA